MASNGLPEGATLTTIDGRRCTAIPRTAAASTIQQAETTTTSISVALTTAAAAATTTPVAVPAAATTAIVAVAAGSADANTVLEEIASISSTSTTSASLVLAITTTSTPPSSIPKAPQEAKVEEPEFALPALVLAPSPAAEAEPPSTELPSTTSASSTLPAPSVIITSSSRPAVSASVIRSSQADNSITAIAAETQAASSPAATALSDVSGAPVLSESAAATPLFTIIGTAQASSDGNGAAQPTGSRSTNSAVSTVPNPNSNAVQSTVAVAGGVIGGVVAISLVAFIVWWWRRKLIRRRRSTLLTPLDAADFGRGEKGGYVINRGSIGPTPMGEKFKAALGYNMKKIRTRMTKSSTPSVNLDRGNSQFMDPVSTHSRANSSALADGAEVTTKDRFMDWWTRLTADMHFNWRLRSDTGREATLPPAVSSNEKRTKLGSQPDFLTLLSMDDRELDREAQRRRGSISRKNGGSAGSGDGFLGGLNLNFGGPNDNPFSDANALAHQSAQPAPLVVSQPSNPFSDANAIRDPPAAAKPASYVVDMRRSRGQSVSSNTTRQPSALYNNRDSVGSVGSFTTHRNKFRSDPFDLERPELLAGARAAKNSITSSTAGTAGSEVRSSRMTGAGEPRRPAGARTRTESFSSKYSSGVSMGDWSDPGPDVGPAASRWDGPEPRQSPTQGWRNRLEREASAAGNGEKRQSGGSQKSVGKAI
ncbi:hypothetical protein B0H63DRAFT_170398 [Podospora didyma]|uniref:Uncharacterized protein n=1 Tax=Podospora didyma TaxID=330526 RepID=A0AAE0NNJ7_9PEZI|nr:hypothetical protein B0H63DRAFT_170398 [Podospora didyma]